MSSSLPNIDLLTRLSSFQSFPRLPFELRLKIWKIALAQCKNRIIPFSLSGPPQCTARFNPYIPHSESMLWTHLSSPQRPPPSLLLVCQESHDLAWPYLAQLPRGLSISHRFTRSNQYAPCPAQLRVVHANQKMIWNPDEDIIWLEESSLIPRCARPGTANPWKINMCQARDREVETFYKFQLDSRIRFLAMGEEMWEKFRKTAAMVFGGVEVVFVVTDRERMGVDLASGNRLNDVEWEEWKKICEFEYSEFYLRDRANGIEVSPWARKKGTVWDGVKAVDSLDEIVREVNLRNKL